MIERLCIIGVGLIGGSLAMALRNAGAVTEIVGCSRHSANLERARVLGVIDRYSVDVAEAVMDADVVVVASPLGAVRTIFSAMRKSLSSQAVLTDVGSAKRCVLEDARAVFGEVPPGLVPAHPIAGTEKSGVGAAFGELFQDHRVILTPVPETSPGARRQVEDMWRATGAEVVTLDPDYHDEVLAATSHLPHMLAYTLVDTLGRMDQHDEIFRFAAGGFRDFTRIASSDPTMWHDICIANRAALVRVLERFETELERTVEKVKAGDGEAIKALFIRAKRLRDQHTQ